MDTYVPVYYEVQAVIYDGTEECAKQIQKECGKDIKITSHLWHPYHSMYIATLEGNMYVAKGDYVVRGVNGEYYPCKPDIFEKKHKKKNQ